MTKLGLPKEPNDWSVDDVVKWVKSILHQDDQDEAEKLRGQKVRGTSLLEMTKIDLEAGIKIFGGYGIPGGPATNLIKAIEGLKTPKGKPFSFLDWTFDS